MNLKHFAIVLIASLSPCSAHAECASTLVINNSSKYILQIVVNGESALFVAKGGTGTAPGIFEPGTNTVVARAVAKTGSGVPGVKGPPANKVVPLCTNGSTNTITYTNKNFIKHGGGAEPKPVGNKQGRKLDLTGVWLSAVNTSCSLQLTDVGLAVNGFYDCGVNSALLQGTRVGGLLLMYGFFVSEVSDEALLTVFNLNIFNDVDFEGEKLDALRGKIFLNNVPPQKITFARIAAE